MLETCYVDCVGVRAVCMEKRIKLIQVAELEEFKKFSIQKVLSQAVII